MKALFSILILLSLNNYAVEDCRSSKDFRVLSHYMSYDYEYDSKENKHHLKKREKKVTELFSDWSEVAGELFEIYFEATEESQLANKVIITYSHMGKKLYNKEYELVRSELSESKGFINKVQNYTFSNGVLPKDKRPGIQSYRFLKNDQPLCELTVKHIYSKEDR